jgi:hypothetical protein
MAGHLNLGVFSVLIYIFLNYHKKIKKKLIIRLKINVLFIEIIIKSKVYSRYTWDDKKITIKSIYKKIHRFSVPKF